MTEINTLTDFARDVDTGFSAFRKTISSRYFYDSKGDVLFRQIMEMPEYYPTDAEFEILQTHSPGIAGILGQGEFDIIEFGAGDAYKTRLLLRQLIEKKLDFRYIPIDISGHVLEKLKAELAIELPELVVEPYQNEYFEALETLSKISGRQKLVLFLGSNIGNFDQSEAFSFIGRIHDHLKKKDLLLLGVDLKKDPAVILRAYNDPAGITARFNLNLLVRMNEELGANFNISNFYHYPMYDPSTGTAKSFLVSKADQDVYIEKLGKSFHFWNGEEIATEISQKYELSHLKDWGKNLNMKLEAIFMDKRLFFTDIVFRK